MAFGIAEVVAGVVGPVTNLIDRLVTTKEEKGQIQLAMAQLQVTFANELLGHEQKLLEAQRTVIESEAKSDSWIARSWRPLTMLTFLALIVFDGLGLLSQPLRPEIFPLLQYGLVGYVGLRSAEKIVPSAIEAFGRMRVGGEGKGK